MILELNMFHTIGIAILVLILGNKVRDKSELLQKYCIPTPVVGGLIFTILTLIGHQTGIFGFNFDFILSDFFMLAFYSSIGFTASIRLLKQGGVKVITFLILSSILVVFQNAIGVFVATLIGQDPLLGLATGSIPTTGGHGTSAVFAPILADLGLANATTITLAAATFGLVAGSLVAGPVGKYLVEKSRRDKEKLQASGTVMKDKIEDIVIDTEEVVDTDNLSNKRLVSAVNQIILAMALGTIISQLLEMVGLTFPASVGGMLASAIFVNVADNSDFLKIPKREISIIGNIALSIFLALSMMKLELWQLVDLAGPMLILLFVQVVLIVIFVIFVTYRFMGKDYDAAVMSSGQVGFGLGAVPTAMANMKTLEETYGPAVQAFFIVPLIGSLFINLVNSVVITFFFNFF